MTSDSPIRTHLPGILVVAALAIALAFYAILPPSRVARTLFFPTATSSALVGERRLVPRTTNRERAMQLVTEEILLGPRLIQHAPVLPRETRIQSFIVADDVAYVDLSVEAILESDRVRLPVDAGLSALRETLLYNFRRLDDVVVTVSGNVPFVPAYRERVPGT